MCDEDVLGGGVYNDALARPGETLLNIPVGNQVKAEVKGVLKQY